MKYLFISLFAALTFTAVPVSAAGIGVTPKSLEITQSTSETTQTEVFIHNTGEYPATYEIVADQWSQLITAHPAAFRLEPGEARGVEVSFAQLPQGSSQTFLSIIADEESDREVPLTGIKIPVVVDVSFASSAQQKKFYPIVIGLILLAFALLVLGVIQYQRWSKWKKLKDQTEEYLYKKFSKKKLLSHYLTQHSLLVISLLAVIIAGTLLVVSLLTHPVLEVGEVVQNAQSIRVELQDPLRKRVFTLDTSTEPYTAFSALQKVSEMYRIPLEYDPPNELGIFVTMVGGFRNGEDQNYWVYEINKEQVPVAADKVILQPGQELLWKFTKPTS